MTEPDFRPAWSAAGPAVRRALELAYQSLAGGGLAVGSVLTDVDGRILAEGRNRAYDPPGGPDALQGTPLAHAELNALAAVPTGRELGTDTLWSTQEPCSMCAAAAAFVGVGRVCYLAPDPWALAARPVRGPAEVETIGPMDGGWLVAANLFFLYGIAAARGTDHPTVARNRDIEPETAGIVLDLLAENGDVGGLTGGRTADETLAQLWPRIAAAAAARSERLG